MSFRVGDPALAHPVWLIADRKDDGAALRDESRCERIRIIDDQAQADRGAAHRSRAEVEGWRILIHDGERVTLHAHLDDELARRCGRAGDLLGPERAPV